MVREVKDPGIDVPPRDPKPLPVGGAMRRNLAELDAHAKKKRVTQGMRKTITFGLDAFELQALDVWGAETGKSRGGIMRDLLRAALLCRTAGQSPTAVMTDAAHRARHYGK